VAPEHDDDPVARPDQDADGAVPLPLAAPRRPRARKRRGLSGALLAGALTGLRDALEDKPPESEAIEIESSGTTHDIDADGLEVDSHEQHFASPPLEPLPSERKPRHRRGAKR
jgi:hypothetical protein